MSSFPKLVIFAGYSNSGKTTHAIPVLRSLGYHILSSSVLLHEFSERLLKDVYKQPSFNSYDRDLKIEATVKTSNSTRLEVTSRSKVKSRQLLIDLAEKALVPTFTRAVFVNALADRVISNLDNDTRFAVECFKSSELHFFTQRLAQAGAYKGVCCFNLRRKEENPYADSRNLIPLAKDIWNDGSYEELEAAITKHVARQSQPKNVESELISQTIISEEIAKLN